MFTHPSTRADTFVLKRWLKILTYTSVPAGCSVLAGKLAGSVPVLTIITMISIIAVALGDCQILSCSTADSIAITIEIVAWLWLKKINKNFIH